MPERRRAAQALAQLRQMAGMDFSGPQCIGAVVEALHQLVRFESSAYFHPQADGGLDVHVESPVLQAVVPDYFDPRILQSQSRLFSHNLHSVGDIAHYGRGPLLLSHMLRVRESELLRSDFHGVVMRPAGMADWLGLGLYTPLGAAVGMLYLFRPPGAPPFAREDAAVLGQLEATLSRALQPSDLAPADTEVRAQGLLIVTPLGRLSWLSPEAEGLMAQAFGWRWRGKGAHLPMELQLLLQRLCWPQPAAAPQPAPLPQGEWRNAHGWFSLRATRLAAACGEGEAVAIHITQRVARGTRLLAALDATGWPQRQRELAYWLARGLPEARIAERMGVSTNTVAYHRRQLYDRLQVRDRQALLARLPPAPHPG